MAKEITYDIIKELGILSVVRGGWTRELNLISWNGAKPEYDIRDWTPNREKLGKGIALSAEEIDKLKDILDRI